MNSILQGRQQGGQVQQHHCTGCAKQASCGSPMVSHHKGFKPVSNAMQQLTELLNPQPNKCSTAMQCTLAKPLARTRNKAFQALMRWQANVLSSLGLKL
jgi:hypothetical protein